MPPTSQAIPRNRSPTIEAPSCASIIFKKTRLEYLSNNKMLNDDLLCATAESRELIKIYGIRVFEQIVQDTDLQLPLSYRSRWLQRPLNIECCVCNTLFGTVAVL